MDQGAGMRFRVLGPVEVIRGDTVLDLGSRKQRTVLAVLVANAGHTVSADRYLQAVWGEDAAEGSIKSLYTYVSNLRRILDPDRTGIIEGSDRGYRLQPPALSLVDWVRFEELASSSEPAELQEALDLWRGRPFQDVEDAWARSITSSWEQKRLAVIEAWADARLASGEADAVIADLEKHIATYPLHEPLWAKLMTALYQSGRQADALAAYQAIRHRLGEELGIDASPELQRLEEQILLQDQTLAAPSRTPTNLPVAATETIGRIAEMESLAKVLESTRLLTVTGAGGVGKTTAARDLARGLLEAFPDGVWWIELASITDPELIPNAMLGAMRVATPANSPPIETLCRRLINSRTLLVLDNCEHLVEGVAGIVAKVLKTAASTKVITTSRIPLGVTGELAFSLPPLSVPEPDALTASTVWESDAGRLFAVRARQSNPDFEVTDANARRVAAICLRLDGLPFAIELAAARLRSMGLSELEGRLDDRFQLLTGGDRSEVPHHQTLRGTMQWSYDLLDVVDQKLYRHLSVFRGGFDLEAAEAVFGDGRVLDLVDSLVAHSLLVADRSQEKTRFSMLETIREHGRELLAVAGEEHQAQAAHLRWIVELVGTGARHLEGNEAPEWIARFRRETDNVRTALTFAVDADPVSGASICAGLSRFWFNYAAEQDVTTLDDATSFLEEGRRWSEAMLKATGDLPDKVRARLLTALGGLLEIRLGRYQDALLKLTEAEKLWEAMGNTRNQGWTVFYQGVASWAVVQIEDTVALFDRAISLHESAEDLFGVAMSKLLRGVAFAAAGEYDRGLADVDAFGRFAKESGNPFLLGHAEDTRALYSVGKTRRATDADRALIVSAINRFRAAQNYACLCHAIHTAAMIVASDGLLEDAARCTGIVEAIRERLGMVVPPYEDRTAQIEGVGLDQLQPETRHRAEGTGHSMNPEEGIDWVVSLVQRSGRP